MASRKVAFITGAASGIGEAVARTLHARGYSLALADRNVIAAEALSSTLVSHNNDLACMAVEVDVTSWESQLAGFSKAVDRFGRIDVAIANAGIGERAFVPNDGDKSEGDFVRPDLAVLDVDLVGVMFTAALAIQQMRRQEVGKDGTRGKIVATASVCGFYCVPSPPGLYRSQAVREDSSVACRTCIDCCSGVVGFVRSYGKYLPEEHMTLNGVCPHVIRTGIRTKAYYDKVAAQGLLTPMSSVTRAFEQCLDSDMSGECVELGPAGVYEVREAPDVVNKESAELNELLYHRGHPLHEAR